MTSLVTGGAGFIGSHLCEVLLEEGEEVVCLDNFWRGREENITHLLGNKNFKLVRGDIRDKSLVSETIKNCDTVYHLAAINGTKYFYEKPLLVMDVNINGTKNILECSMNSDVERVIFASSSEIYGDAIKIPTPEDTLCRLDNPVATLRHSYSGSKFIGEIFCLSYYDKQGLPITILRYFNTYGPRLIGTPYGQVVSIFINRVLSGEPPIIYGDGEQTRSFTYISDAVDATIAIARNPRAVGEVFNIGMEREITINELSTLVLKLCGREDLKPIYEEPLVGDCRRRCPDITKIRETIGWKPRIGLEDGLRRTIEWFRNRMK